MAAAPAGEEGTSGFDFEYHFDFGTGEEAFSSGGVADERAAELMMLDAMYPGSVKRGPDNSSVTVTVTSLADCAVSCDACFEFAEGYPAAQPPLRAVVLKPVQVPVPICARVIATMQNRLMKRACELAQAGEATIVTTLLEEFTRMLVVSARSAALTRSTDADAAFVYSMDYIEANQEFVGHPLIGSLFSMLTSDVVLLVCSLKTTTNTAAATDAAADAAADAAVSTFVRRHDDVRCFVAMRNHRFCKSWTCARCSASRARARRS